MDQDAFRQLLAAPTASSSSATPKPRAWGAPPPKPKATSGPQGKVTDFAPRKKAPAKPKKGPDGEAYRDRAAERRAGKDGDFAQAEKMLEDLKSRETFSEEQLQYLGGDAHHSVLVKGLDHALLARKKHEAALEADAELEDVEDALDEAFEAAPAPAPAPSAAAKKGKSRDDLLAELKAMRAGAAAELGPASAVEGQEEPKKDSRFKPIGADRKGKGKEVPAASGGAGWKAVGAAGGDAAGEKKRRKKKKVAPAGEGGASAPAAAEPTPAKEPTPPPTKPTLPPQPAPDDFDDDADIFGDVGEYGGLGSDSDDDDEAAGASSARQPPPPRPAATAEGSAAAGTKRKYFDDDEEDDLNLSTAPNAVTDLAEKQAAADAAAALAGQGDEGAGEDIEEGGEVRPMRLQGFSSSKGPSARDLLEMDKEAEAEEKRKAKKAKRREKADERERNMTDADRSNRDFLEMQAFLKKKEDKGE
ncbi:hypothetical protein DMC30DRAFT_163435 [Rhodotorula diobovata]|uniref:RED-like N-terminal domain-containing protein n=1 Tax=Rhodotorula diobovata TaxID=5288 RepID=A0A5C5G7H1_9BASI|nr:hypothetical protein DMC30DRAFT_163435 [Rhodotorula diobovata]